MYVPHIISGIVGGVVLIFLIRQFCRCYCCCGSKAEKLHQRQIKSMTDLEESLEGEYPYITACLAFFVILANACIIAGLLLSAESINNLCNHVATGAGVGHTATQEFEVEIDHYESLYFNYTSEMQSVVTQIQEGSDLAKNSMVGLAEAVAAAADASAKAALIDQAEKHFTVINKALAKLEDFNAGGRRMMAAMMGSLMYQGHYGSLAVDVNTLAYIADQAELALDMLDMAASEMEKYCSGDTMMSAVYQFNCTDSMLPRVVGIPNTSFRPAFEQLNFFAQQFNDYVKLVNHTTTVLQQRSVSSRAAVEIFIEQMNVFR
jgi:hypothetical protein